MATKRYYGEESQRLTNEEQAAHDARLASMKAGTYDFSNTLVPAPTEIPLGTVVYDKPVSYYQRIIASMPAARGFDPRHIEGYMRLQHDTLSRLTKRQFAREVKLCVECIREGGLDAAERNAQSFGL